MLIHQTRYHRLPSPRGGNELSCSIPHAMLASRANVEAGDTLRRSTLNTMLLCRTALPCYLDHPEACNTLDGSDDKRRFEPCKPRQRCDVGRIRGPWAGRGKRLCHQRRLPPPSFPNKLSHKPSILGANFDPTITLFREDTSKHRPSIFTFLTTGSTTGQPLGQSDTGILRPLWTPSSPSPWAAHCTE